MVNGQWWRMKGGRKEGGGQEQTHTGQGHGRKEEEGIGGLRIPFSSQLQLAS